MVRQNMCFNDFQVAHLCFMEDKAHIYTQLKDPDEDEMKPDLNTSVSLYGRPQKEGQTGSFCWPKEA
jgi:hypothetical protein